MYKVIHRIVLLLILSLLLGSSSLPAKELQGPTPLRNNPPLDLSKFVTPGEALTYVASWAGFPAGSIKTKVWNTPKKIGSTELYLFEATIQTNDFVSTFYPVKNTLHSYAEITTGYSRIFTRKIKEQNYQANDRVDYYYEHKNALGEISPEIIISLIRNNSVEKLPAQSIPGFLSDPLTIAWLIRGLDFSKIGMKKSILISDRFGTGIITLTLISEEKITIPDLGVFDSLVIKPEASTYDSNQNLIKIEGDARIWIEKNTKIILRAEAESPIGLASAVLRTHNLAALERYATKPTNEGER